MHEVLRSPIPKIQPKLKIGQPNDKYEQEADRVADQIMRMPEPTVQRQVESGEEEEEEMIQTKPIANQITPLVQRQVSSEMAEEDVIQTKAIDNQMTAPASPQESFEVPSSVHEALSSPGQPLDPMTRAFMEPRFNHDFSQVRVYSDAAAEQSTRNVNARAYTAGHNIVFGAGEFTPSTHEGRRLIAHELTHVVQQGGHEGPGRIQRKEITGSVYDTLRKRLPPQDWYSLHREEWQQASATGKEQMLNPANTFMRAAWHNTINLLPGEYQTVNERHNYYDLISYVIEHDPGTPKAARDVRFFHAATAVTGSPGIGSVDKPIGLIKLGADTRQILRDVNAELFALNMGVIRNLLSTWKEPRDPQTPSGRINAFDFDIRMVETEQGVVENFITQNKARFTSSVVQDINATMDPSAFGQFFNFSWQSFDWAIKALGVPKLDFTIRDHRQAIGFASVHIFHRKSEQDYLAFMKLRVPIVRPPNQYTVWGNLNGITLNEGLPGPLLTYDLPVGTLVEVINWSHMMGPYELSDIYAGKVEVRVLDGTYKGKTGWTDFTNLG
ncbi:MAG: DUF4157 domain-containing protein [Leptolyngbyaceae cyanobacterium RU_5_1]|nr:DUF4157 domain-containing protein [Leptolyngbyaceae cyanobacterium RU_5_1]